VPALPPRLVSSSFPPDSFLCSSTLLILAPSSSLLLCSYPALPCYTLLPQVRVALGEEQGPDGLPQRKYMLCQVVAVETRPPGVYK